jgi:hypothetical protein
VAYLESLDRYDQEWTTFTPTVSGTSTAGSFTYVNRVGRYTRIGDTVFVQIYVNISGVSVAAAGSTQITGLPYTAIGADFACAVEGTANLTAGYTALGAYVDASTTRIFVIESGDSLRQSYPAASLSSAFAARIVATYQAVTD